MARPLPLPARGSAGLTKPARARLGVVTALTGLSDSPLPVVLQERLDQYAGEDKLNATFSAVIADFGAPT